MHSQEQVARLRRCSLKQLDAASVHPGVGRGGGGGDGGGRMGPGGGGGGGGGCGGPPRETHTQPCVLK